jgi:hypothetical protein
MRENLAMWILTISDLLLSSMDVRKRDRSTKLVRYPAD